MIKGLRNKVGVLFAGLMLVGAVSLVPVTVYAAPADVQAGVCGGANDLGINPTTGGSCQTDTAVGTNKVNETITLIINIFSSLVGVIAVIMIIWGGMRYITSGGDSGKVTNAKNTIIYALIGLVVVALSQFIVKFVLNKVTQP
ncbi:MAG: pilin [Candidatus Saccharimonadales bacterium]